MRDLNWMAGLASASIRFAFSLAAQAAQPNAPTWPRIRGRGPPISVSRLGYYPPPAWKRPPSSSAWPRPSWKRGRLHRGPAWRMSPPSPSPNTPRAWSQPQALAMLRGLVAEGRKHKVALNIGPAMLNDNDDTAPLALPPPCPGRRRRQLQPRGRRRVRASTGRRSRPPPDLGSSELAANSPNGERDLLFRRYRHS